MLIGLLLLWDEFSVTFVSSLHAHKHAERRREAWAGTTGF